jgi:hypothetical protein
MERGVMVVPVKLEERWRLRISGRTPEREVRTV